MWIKPCGRRSWQPARPMAFAFVMPALASLERSIFVPARLNIHAAGRDVRSGITEARERLRTPGGSAPQQARPAAAF
jgi:hypothetical protein